MQEYKKLANTNMKFCEEIVRAFVMKLFPNKLPDFGDIRREKISRSKTLDPNIATTLNKRPEELGNSKPIIDKCKTDKQ
jgi:hypothetical protein